jgi:hypothetical protein
MKQLKCINEISGFTLGHSYPVVDNGANLVKVFDNNGILRMFDKVEGHKDFKNWFIGEVIKINIIK